MEKIEDFIQIYIEMIMMVRMWVMTLWWYDKDVDNDAYTKNNYVHNDLKIQQ